MPLRIRSRRGWGLPPALARQLRTLLQRTIAQHRLDPATEVNLLVTDDDELAALNARWRGRDMSTDVLSFPAGESPPGTEAAPLLGDLAISRPMVERQALELGHSPEQEMRVLFVHGLLHLLGHDHVQDADHARMEQAAASILESRA